MWFVTLKANKRTLCFERRAQPPRQYVFESKLELTEGETLPLAITSALSAGVLKEVLDSQRLHDPHFCTRDLVADVVGVLLAVGLVLL